MDAVVEAIIAEAEIRKAYLGDEKIESVYFGGGTPSILPLKHLDRIMTRINRCFNIAGNAEVTLEANPDDISREKLMGWQQLGINRLSIGLQSFNNEELKWMNRAHNAMQSESSVKMAQDHGFGNITIDLIYGSRFQTEASWEHTLQRSIDLKIQHVSAYNLTIEAKTALGVWHKKNKEPAVSETLSASQFLVMRATLKQAGFVHYEVSNFGLPGYFARHNSNYWLQKPYLGLGPSAHSFNGSGRTWNISNNHVYVKAVREGQAFSETETLSLKDRYNEYVLTRLRTIWGCDVAEMENIFGTAVVQHFTAGLKRYPLQVYRDKNVVKLNEEGLLMADGIASDLFIL